MGTRVLGSVHKTGGTRPGFSHPALMMAMEGVKVAGSVAGKDRGAKVARLLKIVHTCVGWYIHGCPPGEFIKFMLPLYERTGALPQAFLHRREETPPGVPR